MTGNFGTLEGVVALVGATAVGGGFALRILYGPEPRPTGLWMPTLRRGAPILAGLLAVLAAGWLFGGAGHRAPFDEGVLLGTLAALAVLGLGVPGGTEGPGPAERPLPAYRSAAGVGAGGLAILTVLAVLLGLGTGPAGLLGVAVGPGILLLLGEPSDRLDLRLRFAGLVASLAVATAVVPDTVILRIIVPDALLFPLLIASLGVVAGSVGLLFDRIQGPFYLGAPAASLVGVVLTAAALAEWMPGDGLLVVAVAAGWLGASVAMFLPRWAVFEPADAAAASRAGVALGVIGSFARGLRAVVLGVVAYGAAVLIADETVRMVTPEGAFGVLLAGVSATTAAVVLGAARVASGPGGSPRRVPESLDVVATVWAGLAAAFALPFVIPSLTGIPDFSLSEALGLGTPSTLGGLVLGAIVPFLLASATSGRAGPASVNDLRRWLVGLVPALLALGTALLLGPAALIALGLGAALTGLALGVFWAAAREASASLQAELTPGSAERVALAEAFDARTGWRVAAAVLATTLSALAIVATVVPGTGALGF